MPDWRVATFFRVAVQENWRGIACVASVGSTLRRRQQLSWRLIRMAGLPCSGGCTEDDHLGAIINMENLEEEGRLCDLRAAIDRLRGAMDNVTALCPVHQRKLVHEKMRNCDELARLGNPNYRNRSERNGGKSLGTGA